jgi:diguanylate cyclase (GGDEF)-like protein/PAS domain S-box-containing protein
MMKGQVLSEQEPKGTYYAVVRNGRIQAIIWTLEIMALTVAILLPLRLFADITVPAIVMGLIWALGLLNIELLHYWLRKEAWTNDSNLDLLQKSEQKYRHIIEQSYDGIIMTDEQGKVIEWNRGQEKISGLDREDVLGKPIWDVQYEMTPREHHRPEQLKRITESISELLEKGEQSASQSLQEVTIQHRNGSRHSIQQVLFPIRTHGGYMLGIISRDVTEQSRVHTTLQESEERFRLLYQSAPVSYQSMDSNGKILEINQAWLDELGYSRDEVVGHSFEDFLSDDSRTIFKAILWRYLMMGTIEDIEFEMIRKDGTPISVNYHGKIGYDGDGTFKQTHCVFYNVTDRKKMEQELHRLAVTDSLTGLFNRRHFFELAESEFKRTRRHRQPLSILMIDLDHFKRINDTYGHTIGDRVLQQVTRECKHALREIDVIGRYGGEEFVVLLPQTDQYEAMQAAERLRQRIEDARLTVNDSYVYITISLGVAQYEEMDVNIEALLDRADQALYAAKQGGGNLSKIWAKP